MKITKTFVSKLLRTIKPGLSSGVGNPKPGEFCIMAAFNYALGRPHGDKGLEDCVGDAVRSFDIALNDSAWSSNQAREKGMRREAVAKIGSNQIDQKEFSKILALKVIQKLVPVALRAAAGMKGNTNHAAKLLGAALACEESKTLDAARAAASDASYASDAARAAASYASDAASTAASSAASNAASYAANYASDAANYAASYASDAASYASDAARAAASYASDAVEKDKVLNLCAECAVEALMELKSPGCKWLYLCD